jgi:hypothetical protein
MGPIIGHDLLGSAGLTPGLACTSKTHWTWRAVATNMGDDARRAAVGISIDTL